MSNYLICIVVPVDRARLLDDLVEIAWAFFTAGDATDRDDEGTFRRARGTDGHDELLRVVRVYEDDWPTEARARALENLLRATLAFAAGGRVGKVRVYIEAPLCRHAARARGVTAPVRDTNNNNFGMNNTMEHAS
jgi:hypothetical protein